MSIHHFSDLEVVEAPSGLEIDNQPNIFQPVAGGEFFRRDAADATGLQILVEPDHHGLSCELGIVLVHGMNGGALRTWTADNGVCWPTDLLPSKAPSARIMSWGYNAKPISFGSSEPGSTASINAHARGLIADVNHYRRSNNAEQQKLIFIAHSIGGIILQAALCESMMGTDNLYQNVAGVVFLGTPHRGLQMSRQLQLTFAVLRGLKLGTQSPMLKQLRPNSDALQNISMQFRKVQQRASIEVCSAFETQKTRFVGLVVDEVAAAFGLVNEIVLPLEADHAHPPKFHSDRDINYIRISGVIERWSNLITGTHPHLTAQLGSILRIPGIRDSTEGRALRKSEDGIAPDTKLPPLYHLAPSQSDPTLLSGGNGNETTAASSSRDDGDVIGPNTILPPLPGPRQFSGEEDSISTTESKDKGASSSGNPNETNSNLTLHPPPRLRLFQTDKDREISLEAKFKAPLIGSSGSGTREGDTNRNTVLPHLKLTGSSKSPVDVEHTQSVQSPIINGQFGQFMSEPEEYRSSLPKVGGNGISSILPPFPSSNPSLPSVPPSKAGKAIANGLQTASSAAVAASAWDPPAVAATVGAGVAGAALLVQGIGAMTARETLGVSREALLTSRRAAIASGNSASIAKAALELNREVFEWNKAKGLNVGVGKKKTPGGGGGEPSSYGGAGTLDGSTFPSLEEFSREFHGTPGFQDSSEDEEGGDEWNSVVRPPTYSTLEETKQKGKGKEVMRDTYIESGVTPVMTAQPVRGYSVVRKPVPVASTSSQAGAHGQIKPPVAKRTLFSYGFTIKEPSSQSPISRTSDVSMAQNLSSEPPPTTKASPNVEPSPADSRNTTTEDICENISISTDSRDDRVREEAELENVSDEEETEDVSDPISKIYEAEDSLEKFTSSRVELHTTEAPDPDTEVFVAPRFDPALITDRELIVGNGDDVIEDADSVFFRDEAESNEENEEQEFELQMPNGQIQKEDAEFLVSHSSGEGSTREEPRLETFSDRYMDEHTERKSSIASDLGNGQREADVMDFTRKNIPDEASGLAQLASQNRGSETDATREETRYEKVDSDPSNSQIRENELDECHKLRIPNPPMVNGTKAETQQVTVSGIALPRDADVESSEMDDIAVIEPQIADSGDGDGINKQPTFTPSELQMERLEKEEMTHSVDVEATNLTAGTAEISSIIVRNGNSIEESDSGLVNGVRETQKQVLPTLEQHSHDIVEPVTATCERRELC